MNTKQIAKLSPGRKKWCVLFFHPKISNAAGKPKRVRYGIGTENREEAEKILNDLNAILANEELHPPGAREIASRTYHPTAVACFYEGIEAKIVDPWIKREEIIELPKDGFSIVQLTGPVGAGKTTLVRQLIGTDPERERFPATSNARTTIFDTEIICAPGDFHAVVSFLSPSQVRSYTEECVQAAVMAAAESLGKDSIARKFLTHSEEKFRLSYILGPNPIADEEEEDFDDAPESEARAAEIDNAECEENRTRLVEWLGRCEEIAKRVIGELEDEVGETAVAMTEKDKDAFLQLVSDKLDDDDDISTLVEDIIEEIKERLRFVKAGEFDRDSLEWPIRWRHQAKAENRAEFLKQIRWYASNHAPLFGRLLTPLVEGLRVQGPFKPAGWSAESDVPPIILLDGVGLGHSRGTGVQVSTSITRRFDLAHAIVLVDDATKPILDAAQSLLRIVTASGHERKFGIVFTNFDRMKGDDLGKGQDKRNKVLAAVEQGILSVETALDVQSGVGRRLRRVLESGRIFFVGGIHEAIGERASRTRKELNAMLKFMRDANQPLRPTGVTPCYDLAYLVLRVRAATDEFQKHWNARLGLGYHEGVREEHWTRVKALSRRFANQWSDEYDTMKPVAHLLALLLDKFTAFVGTPREWKPGDASTEAKDEAVARVSAEVSKRLEEYVARRMREEHLNEWTVAYSQRGTGSTRVRAREIRSINEDVAPVPDEVPAPLASKLLDDFREIFREAATAAGAEIIAG
jgi:GTPase SAR1 family protein